MEWFKLTAMTSVLVLLAGSGVSPAFSNDEASANSPPAVTKTLVYKAKPRRTLTVYYPEDWLLPRRLETHR